MPGLDINNDGKTDIKLSLANIVSVLAIFASIIGSYYTLNNKVEKAM